MMWVCVCVCVWLGEVVLSTIKSCQNLLVLFDNTHPSTTFQYSFGISNILCFRTLLNPSVSQNV